MSDNTNAASIAAGVNTSNNVQFASLISANITQADGGTMTMGASGRFEMGSSAFIRSINGGTSIIWYGYETPQRMGFVNANISMDSGSTLTMTNASVGVLGDNTGFVGGFSYPIELRTPRPVATEHLLSVNKLGGNVAAFQNENEGGYSANRFITKPYSLHSTTLAAAVTTVTQSLWVVNSATGLAAGVYITVDKGLTAEETVPIVAISGTTLTVTRSTVGGLPHTHLINGTIQDRYLYERGAIGVDVSTLTLASSQSTFLEVSDYALNGSGQYIDGSAEGSASNFKLLHTIAYGGIGPGDQYLRFHLTNQGLMNWFNRTNNSETGVIIMQLSGTAPVLTVGSPDSATAKAIIDGVNGVKLPFVDTGAVNASSYEGYTVYDSNKKRAYISNGTNWVLL